MKLLLTLCPVALLAVACANPLAPSHTVRLSITVLDAATGVPVVGATCDGAPCDRLRVPVNEVVGIAITAPGYETRVQPYRLSAATTTAIGLRRLP